MTLDELQATLPNGLHDAQLNAVAIDFAIREARLNLDVWIGDLDAKDDETREKYRRAEITLSGLIFWVSEPPQADYPYLQAGSVKIDTGSIESDHNPKIKLPPVPSNAFANWVYVNDWNAFIYVAAVDARLAWLQPE